MVESIKLPIADCQFDQRSCSIGNWQSHLILHLLDRLIGGFARRHAAIELNVRSARHRAAAGRLAIDVADSDRPVAEEFVLLQPFVELFDLHRNLGCLVDRVVEADRIVHRPEILERVDVRRRGLGIEDEGVAALAAGQNILAEAAGQAVTDLQETGRDLLRQVRGLISKKK